MDFVGLGVDGHLALDPGLLGHRHALAEGHHLDDQGEVDGELHVERLTVAADPGHLGANRQQDRSQPLIRGLVATDHQAVAVR